MSYPRWLQTLLLTLTALALIGASVACGSDKGGYSHSSGGHR